MMKASVSMITRCISVALLVSAVPSVYAATGWMEARGDAMGGTGVASAHYGTAALSNPALLTHFGPTDNRLGDFHDKLGKRVIKITARPLHPDTQQQHHRVSLDNQ